MYLVLIGWLYFVLMLAVGQNSAVQSLLVVVLLGFLPTWLVVWIAGRKRRQRQTTGDEIPEFSEPGCAIVWHVAGNNR